MRIRRWKREIRMYRMRIRRLEIIKLTVFNGEVAESESMRFPCFFSSQIGHISVPKIHICCY